MVPALIAAGVPPSKPGIRRAVRWLDDHQNADGGWGEDLRSYDDPAWIGRGASTASQTAWALLALLAAGERGPRRGRPGRALAGRHPARRTAAWDEPQFTGTGFPGDFYINYHLYRMVFPISALGRYLRGPPGADRRRRAGTDSGPCGRPDDRVHGALTGSVRAAAARGPGRAPWPARQRAGRGQRPPCRAGAAPGGAADRIRRGRGRRPGRRAGDAARSPRWRSWHRRRAWPPDLDPGDLVVATEVVTVRDGQPDPATALRAASAPLLAGRAARGRA